MAVTPVYHLPYPALSDSPNVPLHLQQLAQAVEDTLQPVDQRTTPGHLIASRTTSLALPAGGWMAFTFDKVDSAHDATLSGGYPQLPAGWWHITIDAQIRIADGGSGYLSWAGGPFAGTSALTDGYAGVGVSRLTAIPGAGHLITTRAKAAGKPGTLTFARFSAFRTTAPPPDLAHMTATPAL